jgi:hypothetical protein
MGEIVLLAFGAAVFPALLACVAILLSQPEPRRLLAAFWLGGMAVSVSSGLLILARYEAGESVLGSTRSSPEPAVSIVQGVVALGLAWVLITPRTRALGARVRDRHPRLQRRERAADEPGWTERTLKGGSTWLALVVGGAINLPGPLYLIALGNIATGSYSEAGEATLVVLFNLIMFLLVEVPLLGYLVRPEGTAAMVGRLSNWLGANGMRVIAALVAFFGAGLVVQGLAAL